MVTLFFGTIAFLLGIVLLGAHLVSEWSKSRPRRIPLWLQCLLVGLLLLSNFPVAAFILWSVNDVQNSYRGIVINESEQHIESMVVDVCGQQMELGSIAPGKQVETTTSIKQEGSITFTARQGNRQLAGEVEGYAHRGSASSKTIRIRPNHQVEISANYPSSRYATRD